jgi:hypothetical protein
MALCRKCSTVIPCHCHLAPPTEIRPGVYVVKEPPTPTERDGEK